MPSYTAREISSRVEGELIGPGELTLTGVAQMDHARPGDLTFIGDEAHARLWPGCRASAALIGVQFDPPSTEDRALIRVNNADLALIEVLKLFAPPPVNAEPGVHPSAVVDPSAELGQGVCIGANCVVGPGTSIGQGTVLHPSVTVMDRCVIGRDCVLWPGCVVRERCTIGDRCILQPNTTIGADGFGYRPAPDGRSLMAIPQIGTVQIGDDVEIGSATCVDRGKFDATTIGDGTKIDNLCQIAHNCRIGRHCVIAGQTGLAGSITVGDGVQIGGSVGVRDHVSIGSGARLAAGAMVMDSIPAGETWGGMPAREMGQAAREYAVIRKLPEMLKDLKRLKRACEG
jgi:UDP-3-O-[3-hydroxymyristoyl] glucosamine N-acyltransferase